MTRLLKFIISLFVAIMDALQQQAFRWVGRIPPPAGVVLYYHAVEPHERASFARQMDILLRHSKPVAAGCQDSIPAGTWCSAVTFDDGFYSVVENAMPELEARRIPWTFFVPSGCLGQPPSWIKDTRHPSSSQILVTRDQLVKLAENPLITIASHSIHHPNMLKISESEAQEELVRSKRDLETILGKPVELFSFPHGAYSQRLLVLSKQAGYRRIFTIDPKLAFQSAIEELVGRVSVNPGDWPWEFLLKVRGAYRWLSYWTQWRQRLMPE